MDPSSSSSPSAPSGGVSLLARMGMAGGADLASLPPKPTASAAPTSAGPGAPRDSWRGRELLAPEPLRSDRQRSLSRERERSRSPPRRDRPSWRDAPPHAGLPPRPVDRDGRDTYRPHDTYRPGSRSPPPRDRNREREPERDERGYQRPPLARGGDGRDMRYGDSRERRYQPRDPLSQHQLHQQPHQRPPMPPFKPTLGGNGNNSRGGSVGPGGGLAGGARVPSGAHVGTGAGGPANLEERWQLRESTQVNIWPTSPKHPAEELGADAKARDAKTKDGKSRDKDKDKRRRRRRYTSESDSDSEDERERRRRRRKERDRDRDRDRDRERDKDKWRRRADSSDSEDERRTRRSRRASTAASASAAPSSPKPQPPAISDDEPDIGPQLPAASGISDKLDRTALHNLLPGEGAAMQAFVQQGQRIPRRGEIGMDVAQIEALESAGYVMSGSRHARMNAVRIRKEGQVMDAEEKRAHLLQRREAWVEKDGAIQSHFKELLEERVELAKRREEEERQRGEREGR